MTLISSEEFRLGAACRTIYDLICRGVDTHFELAKESGMPEHNVRARCSSLIKHRYVARFKGADGKTRYRPIQVETKTPDGRIVTVFNDRLVDVFKAIGTSEPYESMRVASISRRPDGKYFDRLDMKVEDRGRDTEEAAILISDLHTGAKNEAIDKTKWEAVFKSIQTSTLRLLGHVLGGVDIEKLHVFLLGDVVTGETLFPNQAFEIDMNVMEQIGVFVSNMAALLEALQVAIDGEIHVHCVAGNHGRVSKFSDVDTNWDRLAYEMLRVSMVGNKSIIFEISDREYLMVTVKGHKYMLIHGDGISGYQNIPMYGVVQAMMRWQLALEPFDVLCMGHFHTSSMMNWNDRLIIINGTSYICDRWLMKNLKMTSDPHFWLFGISEKRSMTWQYRVDVDCRKV